jgi:drug/metabolite transporter (DMT)-like permease
MPLAMVVVGNVVYHLGQKSVPRGAHPLVATLGMYLVAAVATLALMPVVSPAPARSSAAASLHWSVAVVGVGIVAIEVGFLLAYRTGWQLSAASLTASTAIAAILLPIGILAYREAWSVSRLLGLGLCVAGLWLVQRR